MKDISEIPAKFSTVADYKKHLDGLRPGAKAISLAKTCRVDICVVFGLREDDRKVFSAHEIELIEYLHEEYQSGAYRPLPGSSAAFFVAMVEEMAGGKPSPDQRDELTAKAMRRCFEMMLTARRKTSFVPIANNDPKRKKFLDDLENLS